MPPTPYHQSICAWEHLCCSQVHSVEYILLSNRLMPSDSSPFCSKLSLCYCALISFCSFALVSMFISCPWNHKIDTVSCLIIMQIALTDWTSMRFLIMMYFGTNFYIFQISIFVVAKICWGGINLKLHFKVKHQSELTRAWPKACLELKPSLTEFGPGTKISSWQPYHSATSSHLIIKLQNFHAMNGSELWINSQQRKSNRALPGIFLIG